MAIATPKDGKASQKSDKGKQKANLEKLLKSRELRQACVLCRVSVYWEGEDKFFRGTVTSCRKHGNQLLFHVDYDDGDADVEPLGEEGTAFKWHGPRGRSGDPPFKDTMRNAMVLLKPQNLQDTPDPTAEVAAPEADGKLSGQAAVGWRINFWWDGTREWIEGEVLAHREADGRHHVLFADGEDEWLHLDRECIRWLGNTKQRGSQLRPIAFGLDAGQLAPKGRDAVKWRVGLHSSTLGRFVRAEIAEFDSATGRHRVCYLQEDADAGERTWISLTASKIAWRFPPGHISADSEAATPAASQGAVESSAATGTHKVAGPAVDAAVSSSVVTGVKREKTPGPTSSAKRQRVSKGGKTPVAAAVTTSVADSTKKAPEATKKAAEAAKNPAEGAKKAGGAEKKQGKDKDKMKDKEGSNGGSGVSDKAKKSGFPIEVEPVTPASARPGKAGCTRSATSQSPDKQAAASAAAVANAASDTPKPPQLAPPSMASTANTKEVVAADKQGRRPSAAVPQPSTCRPQAPAAANKSGQRKDGASTGSDKSAGHGSGLKRDRKMLAPAPRVTLATAAALKNSHVQREAAARARRTSYLAAFAVDDDSSEDTHTYHASTAVADLPEQLESSAFAQSFYAASFTRTTRDLQRSACDFGGDARALLSASEARAAFIQQALRALEEQRSCWVPCKPQCTAIASPRARVCASAPPLRAVLPPPPPRLAPGHTAATDAARLTPAFAAASEGKAQAAPRVTGPVVLQRAPPPPLPVASPPPLQSGVARPVGQPLPRAPPPPLRPPGTTSTLLARPMISLTPAAHPSAPLARPAAAPQPPSGASSAEGTCPAHAAAAAKAAAPQPNGKGVKRPSTPTNGVHDVAQLLSSAGKSTKLGQKAHRVSVGGSASPPSMRGKPLVPNGRTPTPGVPLLQHIILDKTARTCRQQAVARPTVARRLASDNGMLTSPGAPARLGTSPTAASRPWSSPHFASPLGLKGGSVSSGSGSRAAG